MYSFYLKILYVFSPAINLNIFTIEGTSYRISFQTGRHTIAGDIVKEMILMLNIPEEMSDVFSLWMVSKHLRKREGEGLYVVIMNGQRLRKRQPK